jgi:hypothetical protein
MLNFNCIETEISTSAKMNYNFRTAPKSNKRIVEILYGFLHKCISCIYMFNTLKFADKNKVVCELMEP